MLLVPDEAVSCLIFLMNAELVKLELYKGAVFFFSSFFDY